MPRPITKKDVETIDDLFEYIQILSDNNTVEPAGLIINPYCWRKMALQAREKSIYIPENKPQKICGLSVFQSFDIEYGQIIVF